MRINQLHLYFSLLAGYFFFSANIAHAQQDPMYTNYMFNKLVYNPAFTGSNPEFICMTFLYHNQWLGFGGDNEYQGIAPQTQTFSIHAPIPGSNFLGGAGFYVINDKHGFESRTTANFTLSLKKYFSFGTIQVGANVGGIQSAFDGVWKPPDNPNDPGIPVNASDIKPDLGLGMYVFTANKFYVGISSQHLLGGEFNYGGPTNKLVRQSYVVAGYNLLLPANPDIEIQPSILYKIDKAKQQFDVNCNVTYKNKFYGGLNYRQGSPAADISLLLGMRLTPQLTFGYSYDLTTTRILNYSTGSHEVVFNYCFKIVTKTKVVIPNIIWSPRYLKPYN
ncbi:MAG TPA: type IX secretion system membrane protein PorP/SprF [Bacteroidia bacterium]|nr:type IX secretion system membrane protein PorP/SprF [Bacteroidia bacterium]HRS58403.1 type IX secretion system membrane protein PorP/SprF [Bacteroidia bacterium]HRU67353.1 type IX secretion system membrane protein PorP/SprF [Bacteroidia bacterium]